MSANLRRRSTESGCSLTQHGTNETEKSGNDVALVKTRGAWNGVLERADIVKRGSSRSRMKWLRHYTPVTGLLTDADADGTLWNCFRAYCFLAWSLAAKEWNRLKREMILKTGCNLEWNGSRCFDCWTSSFRAVSVLPFIDSSESF